MKCYVKFILLWVALLLPLSLFAVQPPSTALTTGEYQLIHVTTSPDRDEADDDIVVYEYGFEDGWGGWTSMDMTDVSAMWHISEEHAYDNGSSWWCANENLGGYDNHWLQYLKTPVLNLRDHQNFTLQFMLYYACEDPENGAPDPEEWPDYDAWDGCNVWISTDGGDEWEVLTPTEPAYNYESLFSFGWEWDMGPDIPGWCGFSDGWLEASFDLSEYAAQEVQIRWTFCSDPAWATSDDENAVGMLVDEIRILAGDDPIWENDGTEVGDMELDHEQGEPAGDFWELTDADGHESNSSAHCPIRANLSNALITPPLEVPEEGWYTYFDFWLLCNTVAFNPDGDRSLNDFFRIWVSNDDGRSWRYVIHDYGDPGQRPDWYEDWAYYGPGTWWAPEGSQEWQVLLNMTQFAGETIKLRWELITDDIMEGDQGTGLWIDDFRLLTTAQRENDVGLEWLHVGYPITMERTTDCQLMIKNYGMLTQNEIRQYWHIDDEYRAPITPWVNLEPDATEIRNFRLQRLLYSGEVTLYAYTLLGGDDAPENDMIEVDILIYPENMYQLGYDDRQATTYITFETVNPAVLFTPPDDGVPGAFDLQAIDVGWFDNDIEEEVNVTLRIFADNRGDLGDELFSDEIRVIPGVQRINLSEVDALKNLDVDFWVYFNIDRDDRLPWFDGRIISEATPYWGAGHYYVDDGESVDEGEFEVQIQALITTDVSVEPDAVPSREEIDFEGVAVDDVKTIRLTVFGFGTSPVTIESIEIDNNQFFIFYDGEFPVTLALGDYAVFDVSFFPTSMDYVTATLTFNCNDESPPEVTLIGGVLAVGEENSAAPYEFSLGEAYPNPFNSATRLEYSLDMDGYMSLSLYDLSGRKIVNLVEGRMSAGRHEAILEAGVLPTGIYLIKLEASNRTAVKKVALIR